MSINNTNVVDNVLVHNWGQLVREEFGIQTVDVQINKVKTLQDVKMAGRYDNCVIPQDKIRHAAPSPQSSSPSNYSVYGGDTNQMGPKASNDDNNGGSVGDFHGGGKHYKQSVWK